MKRIISIVFVLFLVGCGPSPKLISIAKPLKKIISTSVAGFSDISFLFVLDTSGSTGDFRKTIVKNFQYFLPIMKEHSYYNYNFAITTMSPYKTFNTSYGHPLFIATDELLESCKDFKKFVHKTTVGNYFKYKTQDSNDVNFESISCLLSKSVDSVSGYNDAGYEWYFSALDFLMKQNDKDIARDFFSEKNFLVIIFVSDALGEMTEAHYSLSEGSSNVSITKEGERVGLGKFNEIIKHKGDDQIKAYGVLPLERTKNHVDNCSENIHAIVPFPAHAHNFIKQTSGHAFSVCDKESWGKKLTVISKDIERSFYVPVILIEEVPLVDTIRVLYNDYEIPNDTHEGWYYNAETMSIHIGEDFKYYNYKKSPIVQDNQYTVYYRPLNFNIFREKNVK